MNTEKKIFKLTEEISRLVFQIRLLSAPSTAIEPLKANLVAWDMQISQVRSVIADRSERVLTIGNRVSNFVGDLQVLYALRQGKKNLVALHSALVAVSTPKQQRII